MTDENVLHLPERPSEDEAPITVALWSSKTCEHLRTTVDGKARTFVCRDCQVALDPITWMVSWSHRHVAHDNRLEALRKLQADLTVHCVGRDSATLCGAGKLRVSGTRKFQVTVSNAPFEITCQKCRKMLGDRARSWNRGQPVTVGLDELASVIEGDSL